MYLTERFSKIGSAARFAVPEKIIGLTLFLDFFDRCTALGSLLPPLAALPSLTNELRSSYAYPGWQLRSMLP